MMSLLARRIARGALLATALVVPLANGSVDAQCLPIGGTLRDYRYTGGGYNCGIDVHHGMFIFTAAAKARWATGSSLAADCDSVSAQAVVFKSGVLMNAPRQKDQTLDANYGPTSFVAGTTSLVGTNYWFTRDGVFDTKRQASPFDC